MRSPPPPPRSVTKRKRRPAGTPDPEAEVVSLSPKTLLESDRYVCEICGQGFQRDQNLQMHRRRHKVPWKLLKREAAGEARKRVFVCPEPSCLHHEPSHALGDLVGIKKHFRRKHSSLKQWACHRCSKAYAVHSDFKAHLKTCGTRGHSCDCGRVFSRVESFIEHQDSCTVRPKVQATPISGTAITTGSSSRTASSTSPSSDANLRSRDNSLSPAVVPARPPAILDFPNTAEEQESQCQHFFELQLLPTSSLSPSEINNPSDENFSTKLKLSIGSSSWDCDQKQQQVNVTMAEKAYAEEARREAKRQIAIAEAEFANAIRIRRQAMGELEKAQLLREQASKRISSTMLHITCQACKQHFQDSLAGDETSSLAISYISDEA